jgi:hypothetical protein
MPSPATSLAVPTQARTSATTQANDQPATCGRMGVAEVHLHQGTSLRPRVSRSTWDGRGAGALAVGALLALRVLPAVLGTWSLAAGFAGIALVGIIRVAAGRRARKTRTALLGSAQPLPDAGLLLLLALVVAGGAALGLLYAAGRG